MTHLSLTELSRAVAEGWGRFLGAAVRGEVLSLPGGVLGISGEPFADTNSGYVTGPGAGEALTRFAEGIRRRRLPGVLFAASPVEEEAAAAAAHVGLRPAGVVPLMCCRAAQARRAEDPGYTVRRAVEAAELRAAAAVLADAFDMQTAWCEHLLGPGFAALPDAAVFVAYRLDKAVAACGTARVGGVAGLYAVGAIHAHRRRGAATAAVAGALDAHIAAGAHLFGLLADPAAEGLYAGLGFAPVDVVTSWRVPTA